MVEVAQGFEDVDHVGLFVPVGGLVVTQFFDEGVGEGLDGWHVLALMLSAVFAGEVSNAQVGFAGDLLVE